MRAPRQGLGTLRLTLPLVRDTELVTGPYQLTMLNLSVWDGLNFAKRLVSAVDGFKFGIEHVYNCTRHRPCTSHIHNNYIKSALLFKS